jgi:predicted nucleotidyltransferase
LSSLDRFEFLGGRSRCLQPGGFTGKLPGVKLLFENLPPSLAPQRETLARCLEAMKRAMPLRAVYLFGSHARGDARPDSDVDLCIVTDGAERQLAAAQIFSRPMRSIRPEPSFTLIPITPERLQEKRKIQDFFFETVLTEGARLASEN